MTLLTPLGLLGLLGIVALIIIYIIRPNYQQKFISSTYIWKLSLKYRKKKIPINKLRNILLIICQILAITSAAMILAQPNNILKEEIKEPEVIVIIDSSASMRTTFNEQTRFCRAITKAQELVETTFEENGIVSVIVADGAPSYLQQRATVSDKQMVESKLTDLFEDDEACSYAVADIDGAIALCEEVLYENPDAKIHLFTDTNYAYVPEQIALVNVSENEEWNASILNAKSQFEEPYYAFVVDVACYGRDMTLELRLEVSGANAINSEDETDSFAFTTSVDCIGDNEMKVIFAANPYDEEKNEDEFTEYKNRLESSYSTVCWMGKNKIYSYRSVNISIEESDCFTIDNTYELYDGLREVIKIQYASEKPNIFWPAALAQLTKTYEGIWDIEVTEVKKGNEPALQGFDFYIFEHTIPEELPTDGVVFLMNPDQISSKYGVRVGAVYSTSGRGVSPEEGEAHPITNNVSAERINLTRFTQIILDSSYTPLLSYKQYPLLAVRNEDDVKMVVMPFSLHFSDIAVTEVFPLIVYNVFEYFFPQTVQSNSFEVNEKVELNARGKELRVEGYQFEELFESFPAYITVKTPGTYVMSQTTFAGKEIVERIYVKTPEAECNIKATGEALIDPYQLKDDSEFLQDLLLYIAAGLVALLFIEWWLKGRENA